MALCVASAEEAEIVVWCESTVPLPELVMILLRVPEYHLHRVWRSPGGEWNRRNQIKGRIINICLGIKTRDSLLIHGREPQISARLFTHGRVLWAVFCTSRQNHAGRLLPFAKWPFTYKIQAHLFSNQIQAFEVQLKITWKSLLLTAWCWYEVDRAAVMLITWPAISGSTALTGLNRTFLVTPHRTHALLLIYWKHTYGITKPTSVST
jgi:hypothetical protein